MPKFTVIMPAFNEERHVKDAVESVLNQSMGDLELIVIDDGSDDDTAHVVEQLGARDRRLTLLTPGKIGKVPAFNLAFGGASGAWYYFMGADDIMRPRALEHWSQLVGSREPSRRIAARARLEMFSESPKYHGLKLPKNLHVRNFSGPLTLQSRGMLEVVTPIPESLPNEDTWWGLCIEHFAEEVLLSEDVVVSYRVHGGNSLPRNAPFRDFNGRYHARRRAVWYFLEHYRSRLNEEQVALLEASIRLEEARVRGQVGTVLTCRNVGLKDRMRAVAFGSPLTYRTKLSLDRWLLGH